MPGGYFGATRHPWPCFLFLVPLLASYEAGLIWLGGTNPAVLADIRADGTYGIIYRTWFQVPPPGP